MTEVVDIRKQGCHPNEMHENPVLSIAKWQQHLADIYPNRSTTPDYMMAHIYTACSDVGRSLLRSEAVQRRDQAIISAISWMMAISSHFEIDYEEALISRFPKVCYYCLEAPCRCDVTNRRALDQFGRELPLARVNEDRASKRDSIRNEQIVVTLDWVRKSFLRIYPGNRSLLKRGAQGYVTAKLLEEGGELHRAYSEHLLGKGSLERIAAELADLSAWLLTCWDLDGQQQDFESRFAQNFGRGCPICDKQICVCEIYSITSGQEELIIEITDDLVSLPKLEVLGDELEEAIRVAREAQVDPSKKEELITQASLVMTLIRSDGVAAGEIELIHKRLTKALNDLVKWV